MYVSTPTRQGHMASQSLSRRDTWHRGDPRRAGVVAYLEVLTYLRFRDSRGQLNEMLCGSERWHEIVLILVWKFLLLHYTIWRLRTLCDTTLRDWLSNCWNTLPTNIASYSWNIVLHHPPLWVVFFCVHQFYLCILVLFCDYFHFQQMQHDHDSKWILSADDRVNTDILEHATFTCHVSSGTVSVMYNTIQQAVLRTRESWLKQQASFIYRPEQRTQTETFKIRWATIIRLPFLNKM